MTDNDHIRGYCYGETRILAYAKIQPSHSVNEKSGMMRQEITDESGLAKAQIKNLLTRNNYRQRKLCLGIVTKRKCCPYNRPPSSTEKYE